MKAQLVNPVFLDEVVGATPINQVTTWWLAIEPNNLKVSGAK